MLPSVTNVLDSSLTGPHLIPWAARRERWLVYDLAKRTGLIDLWRRMKDVPHLCETELNVAGDIGDEIHKTIEAHLTGQPRPEWRHEGATRLAFGAFQEWQLKVDLNPIRTETFLFSEDLGVAGTADCFGDVTLPMSGRVQAIIDWKSARWSRLAFLLQVSAYRAMLPVEERANAHCVVVRLPKLERDGTQAHVEVLTPTQADHYSETFRGVVRLFNDNLEYEARREIAA